MSRLFAIALFALACAVWYAAPSSAASLQPYFQGNWRCAKGQTLSVTPAFGPWLNYHTTANGNTAQAFISKDPIGGGWANVGVDSAGGFWTMTSSGWQGATLTYNGTYVFAGSNQTQRQVLTRNANNAMTIQTWRNGALVGQVGCNK